MARRIKPPYPLVLALIFIGSMALFWLGWRYDNKYTMPRPIAQMGFTWLNNAAYRESPFLYLLDGWEFYAGKLLSPAELAAGTATPDAYFYLGRYSGFDLGNAQADPHGQATYRMTVLTGNSAEQEYALELTDIFSRWQLWINGELRQSVGFNAPTLPRPDSRMVTFTARESAEIVVAVTTQNSLYSGMVYPPAFGSPEAVGRALTTRLVIHVAVAAAALLAGLICLAVGIGLRFSRPFAELFLFCVCFCVYVSYPLAQAWGLYGGSFALAGRFCHYALFPLLVWIQGRLTSQPKRQYATVCVLGLLVCAAVLLQPQITVTRAATLYAFGSFLELYKWSIAAWLLLQSALAVLKRSPGSKALLAGLCVFAAALIMDRLKPMYEPVLTGWPEELAGFVLLLCIAGILCYDTLRVYRGNLLLREQQKLAGLQLAAQTQYTELQQEYVRRTERLLHETRNNLVVLRHYAESGETGQMLAYTDELLQSGDLQAVRYSGNALLDAILNIQFSAAVNLGIYVEHEFTDIPARLPMKDGDLAGLLMNILDNAIKACSQLENERDKWLYLHMSYEGSCLSLHCGNSASSQIRVKDKPGHGYGWGIIQEITARYNGCAESNRQDDSFEVAARLELTAQQIKQ